MKKLLLFSLTFLMACNHKFIPPDYESLSYKRDLSNELAFDFMDEKFETGFLGNLDSTQRATTNSKLVVVNDSSNNFLVVDNLSCCSWMHQDTLWVHISQSDGFTRHGINIKIKDGKFNCIPYYFTDI